MSKEIQTISYFPAGSLKRTVWTALRSSCDLRSILRFRRCLGTIVQSIKINNFVVYRTIIWHPTMATPMSKALINVFHDEEFYLEDIIFQVRTS